MLLLIFYALLSIVLLNLFIGIVTDVYPKARARSELEWEKLITDLMLRDLQEQVHVHSQDLAAQKTAAAAAATAAAKAAKANAAGASAVAAEPPTWRARWCWGCCWCCRRCCGQRQATAVLPTKRISTASAAPAAPTVAAVRPPLGTRVVGWLLGHRDTGNLAQQAEEFDRGKSTLDAMQALSDQLMDSVDSAVLPSGGSNANKLSDVGGGAGKPPETLRQQVAALVASAAAAAPASGVSDSWSAAPHGTPTADAELLRGLQRLLGQPL